MLADIASEHPHLLDIYKDLAREETKIMVNIAKDDISVAQACIDLEKALGLLRQARRMQIVIT